MRQGWIWFVLSCKRYLRKVSFLLILLVLPAATFFIRGLEKEEGQEVRIAVCAEGMEAYGTEEQEPLEHALVMALIQGTEDHGDGTDGAFRAAADKTQRPLFRFYLCENEEQVKAQVASRRAECGYVISGDLRKKLDERDYKRCIRVYSAPSTVLSALSTEVVFASLMKLYDKEIFLDYIAEAVAVTEQGNAQPESMIEELAGSLYDKWLNNGSTFRFEYRYQNRAGNSAGLAGEQEEENPIKQKQAKQDRNSQAPMVFPVRGIVAVYLLLAGLYSAVMLGTDEKKGLFLPLSPGTRLVCQIAVLGAPVFLAALSALAALKTGGCLQEPVRELWIMGLYAAAVCVFAYGVKVICRRPQVVCCLIPLFLVGSLIFTPVFVDIRQFFPAWGWIEKLFLPAYYLRAIRR